MPVNTIIKLRGGTAAQWASTNPVLNAREMGVETDTRKFKFGNGTSQWSSLAYAVGSVSADGVVVEWENVANKPTEFAPSAHTHVMADITNYVEPIIPEVTFSNTFMMMGA